MSCLWYGFLARSLRRCGSIAAFRVLPLVVMVLLCACSGPDTKKMRFYSRAQAFMNSGDLVKAELELKNAIQIDPKYADAHYLMGQVAMKRGKYQQAFKSFSRAVELKPDNLDAQVHLGRLFLLHGDVARAQEKVDLVLKADARQTGGKLLQGSILIARKEWGALAPLGEGLIAGGVTRPDPYLMLALARSSLNNAAGAESALLEGAQLNPADLGIQRTLADFYAARWRVDDAAARIRRMMELEPANFRYGITLAGLYWNSERQAEARDTLTKLAAANRDNEECLVAVAGFYLSHRLTEDGEKLLKDGLTALPRSFMLRFALSELYNISSRSDAALAVLKECLGLLKDPKSPELIQARNLLARLYFLRGELPEAERYLGEILTVSAANIDATYLKGRISLQKKDAAGAISAFRSLINDRPHDAEGYLLLADAHLLNRELKLAQENLLQAERIEPDSLRVVRALARFAVAEGQPRAGLERLQRFLVKEPGNVEARVELGELYRLGGDPRRAVEELKGAKQRAPGAAAPYLRLSELYDRQGDLPRAIAELEMVVTRLMPGNIPAALTLADLYGRAGASAKARQTFEELLTKNPKEWHISNDYACFLADNGTTPEDFARAAALATDAAGRQPDNPQVLDTLGWAEHRRGNTTRALELLRKASEKSGGSQMVEYHLGMVCSVAGRKDEARTHLERALVGGDFPAKSRTLEALKRL